MDNFYNKINDYGMVQISLASAEIIRGWSSGEVRKPETINYRTYRPERDGLFCEKIFGPERDYECLCGKYKGIKYKGVVCDRCGVKVTTNKVRRKRFGHINLAAPVVHIWFFKAMPSRIGALLGLKVNELEKVIYFQSYIVTDVEDENIKLKEQQLLSDEEYREYKKRYRDAFTAKMGAEAVKRMLEKMNLKELSEDLRVKLRETRSQQKKKDIIKRLKTIELLRNSDEVNKPENMVLDVIPVIPPDLRPLILLESGNFATSDLNDLYRRLINRNNRLKKLIDLNSPEVIIRNEKRMLQQSVDALFDNARCKRPVTGSSGRPLKSLTDMIKGKQGRFRENLLGKRVDYSGRSVIVVDPQLHLHQCGLPKKIALELFQPFIIRLLKERGFADTIKSAKKLLERKTPEVWDILDEVIQNHPVLLNRAPTLHRMGIQAFEPVLVEGNAITLHPLVCAGFNADFDGDQMAVHLPLSLEAQTEAYTLMLSTHNIFSPAHGNPIITPSHDIVLGCFYMTADLMEVPGFDERKAPHFADKNEALMAFAHGKIDKHTKIWVRFSENDEVLKKHEMADDRIWLPENQYPYVVKNNKDEVISYEWKNKQWNNTEKQAFLKSNFSKKYLTTAGRILFSDMLPEGMPFYNFALKKKDLQKIIAICFRRLGKKLTLKMLDDMKEFGFKSATLGGISISKDDLRIPDRKYDIVNQAQDRADQIMEQFEQMMITENERSSLIIDIWTAARDEIGKEMMHQLEYDKRPRKSDGVMYPYLNPIYMMAFSGARGSVDQVRQLAGMRGLVAKPGGKIIETPIKANFREGLRVLEYFSSTHGARKGLADTALKTADSGYMTRKLADVAQNVVVNEYDCGAIMGVKKCAINKGEKNEVPLRDILRGRITVHRITDSKRNIIIEANELITDDIADKIDEANILEVEVRSALRCQSPLGVCAKCYGADLSSAKIVEEGLAVGIIAAQSIGEPGTQLTMRTFHIGGIAMATSKQDNYQTRNKGKVVFKNVEWALNSLKVRIVLKRGGELAILNKSGKEVESYELQPGYHILVDEGDIVKAGKRIVEWDPHSTPILSEVAGKISFSDLIPGQTFKTEQHKGSDKQVSIVIDHKGYLHPEIVIEDAKSGDTLAFYPLPIKALIEVKEGQIVKVGDELAKTPLAVVSSHDIVGGLPRVQELFDARSPKNPAVLAEMTGVVELSEERRRGKRIVIVRDPTTDNALEHLVAAGKQLRVRTGDKVFAGEPLDVGPIVPKQLLRIAGVNAVTEYILNEVQNVYRDQGVQINDKHIEVILSQMLRKVQITDKPGDTELLPDQTIDKFILKTYNEKVQSEGGMPASYRPLLMGVTKASLATESFLSAASFQETTKVLTEAALAGKEDNLLGLKENVILGHIIPAGTGFKAYYQGKVIVVGKENDDEEEPEIFESKKEKVKNEVKEKTVAVVEDAPITAEVKE